MIALAAVITESLKQIRELEARSRGVVGEPNRAQPRRVVSGITQRVNCCSDRRISRERRSSLMGSVYCFSGFAINFERPLWWSHFFAATAQFWAEDCRRILLT